jgi:hypothetical protein
LTLFCPLRLSPSSQILSLSDAHEALEKEHNQLIAERDRAAAERDRAAAERLRVVAERDGTAAERDRTAAERDRVLKEKATLSSRLEAFDTAVEIDSRVVEATRQFEKSEERRARLSEQYEEACGYNVRWRLRFEKLGLGAESTAKDTKLAEVRKQLKELETVRLLSPFFFYSTDPSLLSRKRPPSPRKSLPSPVKSGLRSSNGCVSSFLPSPIADDASLQCSQVELQQLKVTNASEIRHLQAEVRTLKTRAEDAEKALEEAKDSDGRSTPDSKLCVFPPLIVLASSY